MKQFFTNGFKGVFTLVLASLIFVTAITFFPIIGSLTVKGFPLSQVLLDNLHLLLILTAVNIPLGFFLGSIAGKLKQKRILILSLLGFVFYWLIIILVILAFSRFTVSMNIFVSLVRLSVWAMLAYSFYAVPFIMVAVFLLEKWTRKK